MQARLIRAQKPIKLENTTVLVLGDGMSLLDDLERFLAWRVAHDVAAIGRSIKQYPDRVQHWFNADGECAGHWAKNLPNGEGTIKHTLGEIDGFDCDWEIEQPDYNYERITGERDRLHGSSAIFATLACLAMGYRSIVLAGCPMDCGGHWYYAEHLDSFGPIWLGMDLMVWIDFAQSEDAECVRSMSGYTAKILGEATKSWL